MNKTKPWLERFEMYGNLPAALQRGTVVSASINKTKEVDRKLCERNPKKERRRGAQ